MDKSHINTAYPKARHFKIVLVGDPGSGKSEVKRAYIQLSTAKEKIEQIDSNVAKVGDFIVELLIIDLEREFEKILLMNRNLLLDAVILFYNILNPLQFERAHNRWIPLIKRLYKGTPFVICATGIEARQDFEERKSLLLSQIDIIKSNINLNSNSVSNKLDNQTSLNSSKLSLTSLLISDSDEDTSFKEKNTNLENIPTSPILNRMCLSPIKKKLNISNKDTFRSLVSNQLGNNLAFHYGASAFKEVSYKTFEGIQNLFEETVAHIVKANKIKFSLVRNRVGLSLPRHIYHLF